MKIKSFTYQAVKNLGNYESERLEATADVEEGENAQDVAIELRQWVNLLLDAHPKLMKEPTGEKQPEDKEDMF